MLLRWLGELVAPSRCAACDEPVDPLRYVLFCEVCAATVEPAPMGAGAAFVYGGAMAQAIARLKYAARPDLGSRLGAAMAASASVARLAQEVDVVVPVPLHPLRAAERGYNQAALIARPIARALSVPLAARALARVRATPRQASLDRAHRLTNVSAAFRAREPRRLRGARVLLLDDVRTTGATLVACAEALASASPREIIPFVLATRADELHG